jgi:hypothetical protein
MKVYIKEHNFGAGKWIYNGYFSAWKSLGYDVFFYSNLLKIKNEKDFYLMALDADVTSQTLRILENSNKTFLYTQPNSFPSPWGQHPNFQCHCPDNVIPKINKMSNVKQWTFGEIKKQFHNKWKNVNTVLLAFDNINYSPEFAPYKFNFDVCYVGGEANNGFGEKIKIMEHYLSTLKKTKLKYGFFINQNLSHEEECSLFYTSKVAINLHDNYQRTLNLCDINERHFKSLGTTGCLVSDKVKGLNELFPDVPTTNSPEESINQINCFLSLTEKELNNIKEKNRNMILENHTYTKRIEALLSL